MDTPIMSCGGISMESRRLWRRRRRRRRRKVYSKLTQ
jgi:hypothetical protein